MNTTNRIIKHKTGLLNLAEALGKVPKASEVMGMSRDTFYRSKSAVEDFGPVPFKCRPSARLSHFPFENDRAFPAKC